LVGDEEEGLVANDAAAEGAAELVAFERWNGVGKEIAGVEFFVAEEFKGAAVVKTSKLRPADS